jgi:myo-inositol-1(or 4)-monophosphatase
MNSHISILTAAARIGGNELEKCFDHYLSGKRLKTRQKSTPADLQTIADRASNRKILALIRSTPLLRRSNIVSEETKSVDRGSKYTIVIDPLDGTHNFTIGIPYFAVAIALMYEAETIAAVVYNPMMNWMYTAEKGKGAFRNGKRIRVNPRPRSEHPTVSLIRGYKSSHIFARTLEDNLSDIKVQRKLQFWCPALDFCLLASGRIESIINNNEQPYDVVPGKFIAREAGAHISDFRGASDVSSDGGKFIASCNKKVHKAIVGAVSLICS